MVRDASYACKMTLGPFIILREGSSGFHTPSMFGRPLVAGGVSLGIGRETLHMHFCSYLLLLVLEVTAQHV